MCVTGSVAVFFFHPAVFVQAGCGTYLIVPAGSRPAPRKILFLIALTDAVWLAVFSVNDWFLLRKLNADTYLHDYWILGSAPLPPQSWADVRWYSWALRQFVEVTMGFKALQWLMIGAIALGTLAVLDRRKLQEWLFLFPVGFALLTSGLSSYPLWDRLILWIMPLALLAACAGIDQFSRLVPNRFRCATPFLAGALLIYQTCRSPSGNTPSRKAINC